MTAIEKNRINLIAIVIDPNKSFTSTTLKHFEIVKNKFGINSDFILIMNKMDLCFNRRKLNDLVVLAESKINFK